MVSGVDGRVVLVTGACGDLGLAVTKLLQSAGAIVLASDVAATGEASRLLGSAPGEYVQCDVRRRSEVEALVERAVATYGRIDALVAAAGIVRWTPALEVTEAVWDEVIAVNLTGGFTTAQVVAQAMRRQGTPGSMVLIGSWIGDTPSRSLLPYCVSKAGLKMLGRCLALELGPIGIRVNVVAPGVIDAGVSAKVFEAAPDRRAALEQVIPMGRLGVPRQVADCVAFLLSGAAEYVTGATLVVDGGIRLAHDGG